eukprot:201039_1
MAELQVDLNSNLIRIAPIPGTVSESDIYDFIMTAITDAPTSINIRKPNKALKAAYPEYAVHKIQQSFIALQTKADAVTCADALDKTEFAGFTCDVSVIAQSQIPFFFSKDSHDQTNWIQLSGLENTITEQNIVTHIQKHAGIDDAPKSIHLFQHPTKPNYLGFAFIECASASDATQCVDKLKRTLFNGIKIWCSWRRSGKDFFKNRKESLKGDTKQVVLSNVHYLFTQKDVEDMCAEYGEVEEVKMWCDEAGFPTGTALCTMEDEKDASKVFEGLHGKEVKKLKVNTALINKKDNKKKDELRKEVLKNKKIAKKMQRNRRGRARGRGKARGGRSRGRGRGPKVA